MAVGLGCAQFAMSGWLHRGKAVSRTVSRMGKSLLREKFRRNGATCGTIANAANRGCGSMVELKPSKLLTRVRFPSPAPLKPQVRALSALTFFVCGPSCGPNAGQIGKKLQTLLFRALHTGSCLLGRAPAFNCASDPPKAITGRSYILMRACDCSFSSMTLSREQRA